MGSYNSEVGVPLTVTRVTDDTRFLVVEMGARGIGHIAYLTRIAPPRIGVVLNVGTAHVGEFGSREAIARAKAELVEALPADGVAVLNADDPVGARHGRAAPTPGSSSSARRADATVRAEDVTVGADGRARFRAVTPQGETTISLRLVGRHHVGNALAVLAVALECGIPLEQASRSVAGADVVSRWRMEVTERADGVTVVNDAYNANPDSMRAALAALESMGEGRRTWAVLGSMLELGDESDADHADVGAEAQRRGVDELVVVGETARPMADVAPVDGTRIRWVADADAAEALLRAEVAAPDVVLFKSSRDAGLRWLGDRLTADPAPTARPTPTTGGPPVKAVLVAAVVSLVVALFGTPMFIKWLVKQGYGQFIRDDGPTSHHTKRGTPTMGGAVIVAATLAAYAHGAPRLLVDAELERGARALPHGGPGARRLPRRLHQDQQAAQPRAAVQGEALRADASSRRSSRSSRCSFPNDSGRTPASTKISFVRDTNLDLAFAGTIVGVLLFILFANVIIAGTSNGVNLTDGLDGLATGASVMTFAAYVLIGIWQFNQNCQTNPGIKCYEVRDPLDIAIVAASVMGACFGFLWWNGSPGQDLHGRHRLARARRRARRARHRHPHRVPRRHPRRPLRHHHALGDHPGRVVQVDRQTRLPDGARCSTTSSSSGGRRSRSSSASGSSPASSSPSGLGLFYAEWVVGAA